MSVAVIGAGPAGLMAAEVLAHGGAQRHRLRRDAVGRPQIPDGRAGRTQSDPQRAVAAIPGALPRSDAASATCDRGVSAGRLARLERGAGTADLCRHQRPGVSESVQGLALAARLAAPARRMRACSSRSAIAGLVGTTDGRLLFRDAGRPARRRSARDRAGAWRRKLAAARLGWRVGGNTRRERRNDLAAQAGQFRLHRRLVRYLPRPLRGPAAQGRCADVRSAHRARRGDHHPHRHRRRRDLCAVGGIARSRASRRAGDAEHRIAARSRNR